MKIQSKDVLQADSLDRLKLTIEAIASGAHTFREIAVAIGDLHERQGRYYRRAAEVLGFADRQTKNVSTPSELGRQFFQGDSSEKHAILVNSILRDSIFVRLVSFIESRGANGCTEDEIATFLTSLANLDAVTMLRRRLSSYLSLLEQIGVIELSDHHYIFQELPSVASTINLSSDEEPLLPTRYDLEEFQEQAQRVRKSQESIQYFVDQAHLERANNAHQTLVNLMAEKLRAYGSVPRANRFIDLSARIGDKSFLFEMKSTTEGNLHHQVRRGLSQLYEYRYIQNLPDAKLVLVLETSLPKKMAWMAEYLIRDRNVLLVWDGNNRFYCPESISDQLTFI